jgi:hypothetical protein
MRLLALRLCGGRPEKWSIGEDGTTANISRTEMNAHYPVYLVDFYLMYITIDQ